MVNNSDLTSGVLIVVRALIATETFCFTVSPTFFIRDVTALVAGCLFSTSRGLLAVTANSFSWSCFLFFLKKFILDLLRV